MLGSPGVRERLCQGRCRTPTPHLGRGSRVGVRNGAEEASPLAQAADALHAQRQGQEGLQVGGQVLQPDLLKGRVVLELVAAHHQGHLHLHSGRQATGHAHKLW